MPEQPCTHAVPQAASQLHGVCIFCYRDRLAAARSEVALLRASLNARIEGPMRRLPDGVYLVQETSRGFQAVQIARPGECPELESQIKGASDGN